MRWIWIDRITELTPHKRLVAIKNVSLAEDALHDHFAADPERGLPARPVYPASLLIEGMAQSAGILVGHSGGYQEKVILAKIGRAELRFDIGPGTTIRFTADLTRLDQAGAATEGLVEAMDHGRPERGYVEVGRIDLMFSHVDRNMAGTVFPEHNFVFTRSFETLLKTSGIDVSFAEQQR